MGHPWHSLPSGVPSSQAVEFCASCFGDRDRGTPRLGHLNKVQVTSLRKHSGQKGKCLPRQPTAGAGG